MKATLKSAVSVNDDETTIIDIWDEAAGVKRHNAISVAWRKCFRDGYKYDSVEVAMWSGKFSPKETDSYMVMVQLASTLSRLSREAAVAIAEIDLTGHLNDERTS